MPITSGPGPADQHQLPARRPDQEGSTGALTGNNVYNTDGTNQTRSASKAIGASVTFYISIQNDGAAADSFKVSGAGSTTMYSVRYYKGTTEITSAVVAGTYQTASLAVGSTTQVKAVVKVKSTATVGSSITRLVTITSTNDCTKHDAVKFTVTAFLADCLTTATNPPTRLSAHSRARSSSPSISSLCEVTRKLSGSVASSKP